MRHSISAKRLRQIIKEEIQLFYENIDDLTASIEKQNVKEPEELEKVLKNYLKQGGGEAKKELEDSAAVKEIKAAYEGNPEDVIKAIKAVIEAEPKGGADVSGSPSAVLTKIADLLGNPDLKTPLVSAVKLKAAGKEPSDLQPGQKLALADALLKLIFADAGLTGKVAAELKKISEKQ